MRKKLKPRFEVIVFDMFDYGEKEYVGDFPTFKQAKEYARRRIRDSLENERPQSKDAADLKDRWFSFGEDCSVVAGNYKSEDELDFFIAHPATPAERDWLSLDPRPQLRPALKRQAQVAISINNSACAES
jgi:hypothetical protein